MEFDFFHTDQECTAAPAWSFQIRVSSRSRASADRPSVATNAAWPCRPSRRPLPIRWLADAEEQARTGPRHHCGIPVWLNFTDSPFFFNSEKESW